MKYAYADYRHELEFYRYTDYDSPYSWWGDKSTDWTAGHSVTFGYRVANAAMTNVVVRTVPDSAALLGGCRV